MKLNTIRVIFYKTLAVFWFIPFGFYAGPIKRTGRTPHPLVPRNLQDLTLHKMMFPDNIYRAVVADKIAVRGWIAERVGAKYLTRLYDICDKFEDLKQQEYPLPCVIKTNHASGQVHFVDCPEDYAELVAKAPVWLSKEYRPKHEWVYRDIVPKLMVEAMLLDAVGNLPSDIKTYCFHGEPILIVMTEGVKGRARNKVKDWYFFDSDWEKLDICRDIQKSGPAPKRPENYDELMGVIRTLAKDFDYIRVDTFITNGKIYVGELTNFCSGGQFVHTPHEFDAYLLDEYKRLGKKKVFDLREKYSAQALM